MTDKKRPPLPKFTTPAGIAVYPYLIEPDTKYNPDGEYRAKLRVPQADAQPLIEKLEAIQAEYIKTLDPKVRKTHKPEDVYEIELDDNGDETGNVLFKFKLKRKVTVKSTGKSFLQKPMLFDASKNDITGKLKEMWSGSKLKISGEVFPYANATNKSIGLSLRPKGVQVLTLVAGGGARSADDFGFGEEEGGFVGSDAPSFDETENDSPAASSEDDDEF